MVTASKFVESTSLFETLKLIWFQVDRVNSIKMQEEIERKRIEERRIGALQIMQQIQENEQVSHFMKWN